MKPTELEIEISETIQAIQNIMKTDDKLGLNLAEEDLRGLKEAQKIVSPNK